MASTPGKLGILVGGGPAPGINSVIGAATIRALLEGVEVIGIRNGFENLIKGDTSQVIPLSIEAVSRVHFRGGSILGIARANPTKDPKHLQQVVATLEQLGIDKLITIGGDDTAWSALNIERAAAGRIRVAHVPKTIDNDLDIPYTDTFGFQTARHIGSEIVKNLMVDAHTTTRWYFIISMGRKAGHLALGMGKAAGATLTLIPEEFSARPIKMKTLVDTLVGAIVKRLAAGRRDGVAIIAEGVVLDVDPADLAELSTAERDEHGHVRIAEIDLGTILKRAVERRLAELELKATIVAKNIGYELRCADPIPFDMEYCRDLGYVAAKFLLEGGTAALCTMQSGQFVPIPFPELIDPQTGRTKVRMVDIHSTRYAIGRRYMIRVRRDDFEHPQELEQLARAAHMTVEQFRESFEHLTKDEPPPLHFVER